MRTVELAKVAAAAEALRLRRLARRQALRAVYAAVAAVFAVAVLVVVHVLIWMVLLIWVSPIIATIILLALDAVVAVVFGMMALHSTPDTVEIEAKALRHQALIELRESLTFMSMVAQIAGSVFRTSAREGIRRSAATAVGEIASRLLGR